MKSTIGFGSFGWSGKWPAPSVTRTVIFPPCSVYRFTATRVWSLSHGLRPPQSCRIGAPALAGGGRFSIRLRLRHQAAHERIPGVDHRDLCPGLRIVNLLTGAEHPPPRNTCKHLL